MTVPTTWTIAHRCGHETERDLSDRPADRRAGFARWLATTDCTDCWRASRNENTVGKKEWLAAKRAEEQQAAAEWAEQYEMPPLNGPEKLTAWGERTRHRLVTAAYTTLVVEGGWSETAWAAVEEQARNVTRAGWWIDQRDADGGDLPELLRAATGDDTGNPHR